MPLFNMEIKRNPIGDNLYHPSMEVFADKVINTIDSLDVVNITTVQCFDVETLNYLHKKYICPSLKLRIILHHYFSDGGMPILFILF